MCGIFGAISTRDSFDSETYGQFKELTDLVRYRGPDDSGYVTLSLSEGVSRGSESFEIFLGNRRLSILDLSSAGHQPMTDGIGNWITFNGEIFNFVELRHELEGRGHKFSTGTDTEVILHIYNEYGEGGFAKLNGMWAFAIADTRRRRVVLSRDRFSIKPLYLLDKGRGQYFFGSEIKQLLPLLDKRDLNLEVMSTFLAQGLLDHSAETFFRGIAKLPPKTNLVISLVDGCSSRQQYWDFAVGQSANSNDPVEEFRELLFDSTRIRLRSDVPVGLLLSGGLDSSALAAACRKASGNSIRAYSVISTDARISEERYADAVVERFQLESQKLLMRHGDALECLDEVLNHMDEPFGSFSVVAQFKILQAIKEQGKSVVLLSGQGGDEALLGYLKFFFFYLRHLARKRWYAKAATVAMLSFMRGTVLRQFSLREAKRYIPFLNNESLRFLRFTGRRESIWEAEDLRQRQILDIDQYSVPALTHYEDRNASAHSLEIRHPFLDHRLANFLVNLPAERKIRNGWTKAILRESLPELPPSVRWRKSKIYFSVAEENWLKTELSGLVYKAFAKSVLDQNGVIDSKAFLNMYADFRKGSAGVSAHVISRTLIAELWAQKFLSHDS
jgi:asparagine synthase (glutamine-hydrolysing)